ncbi:MAG: NAD+ synthase [Chlamydiales bacterium 38-26]|nr:NAD+ synthase [Chlamydiales bacterium]OJV11432.1 MAG: NAD+ synthase [Chlamydiales bacterium 38-26]
MKILAAQINPTIGDLQGNANLVISSIEQSRSIGADLVLFPELTLTGYPPQDLLLLPHFIDEVERQLDRVVQASKDIIVIVGLPRRNPALKEKNLFNSAAVIQNQALLGFQDKTLLPTYDVFSERRYFEPAEELKIWELLGQKVAITICEDIWQHSALLKETYYKINPIEVLQKLQPDLLLNLSASPFSINKLQNRLKVCSLAASALKCSLILCNQVGGNDSLIFDGHSVYVDNQGQVKLIGRGFEEDSVLVDTSATYPPYKNNSTPNKELYSALVLGVKDYFKKSGFKKACLGLSGGIDSAVAACLAVEALGAENVLGVSMPSRYSSEGSRIDAEQLAKNLGIEYEVISIEKPFSSYLELLNPFFDHRPADSTEENLQARIRGMILMALSNKQGYIILSTGNKSELAMGYSTLYGDMCGGLAILSDVSKMQVYALAQWINRLHEIIPISSITKAPSAELRPNQTDQDSLPPYSVIDQVLQAYVEEHQAPQEIANKYGYPIEIVQDLIRRIHLNEYKRRQAPPGLRVTEKAFSEGRRFPIVEHWIR